MSLREMSTRTRREHFLAYALATACDLILLVPQSQLSARAGQQLDIVLPIVLHQLLIGVLVVLLSVSGGLKTWRWQYRAVGGLFASYVGFRIATRFVAALELINSIASQGAAVTGTLPMLYFYGLAAAATYTGMILAMRRAYGKLASTRSWPQNFNRTNPPSRKSQIVLPLEKDRMKPHWVADNQHDLVSRETPICYPPCPLPC